MKEINKLRKIAQDIVDEARSLRAVVHSPASRPTNAQIARYELLKELAGPVVEAASVATRVVNGS